MSTPPPASEVVPAVSAHVAAATEPPLGLLGSVSVFVRSQEKWSEYAERLVHYFIANDIAGEDKRRAILLNAVGPGTYRLLKTLASPKKVDELTFEELVKLAKVHFNPKPSPIVKRFEFNCQKDGESIAMYVAELRKIAEYCEYDMVLNDMLRDRLVCGTSNEGIQRRLLLEPSLTFDKAVEMALAAEAVEKNSRLLMGVTPDKDLSSIVNSGQTPATSIRWGSTNHKTIPAE